MIPSHSNRQDLTRTTLAVLCISILIAASFWILRPFLIAMIWALIIVVATWPLLLMVQGRLWGRRGLAVAVMTLILLLVIVAPLIAAVSAIAVKADDIVAWIKSLSSMKAPPPPEWLNKIPVVGGEIGEYWRRYAALSPEELSALVTPYALNIINWFLAQAGNLVGIVFQFLLTVIIAALIYANGETAASAIRGFARRLAGAQGEAAAVLAAKAIRSVALGIVVTAIIQTAIAGLGLIIAGMPAAFVLTAVVLILCLAQLGPILVMVPSVAWVYWKGSILWGTVLLVFAVIASTIDNFIRPVLIRKGANLPLIVIFAGVIGGLVAFGIIGLFIGPVALAVTYTLLKAWVSDARPPERPLPAACLRFSAARAGRGRRRRRSSHPPHLKACFPSQAQTRRR